MEYADLMLMISLETKRLRDNVLEYHAWETFTGDPPMSGRDLDKNGGVNKTAIRRQILDIRQQLLELDKCFR